MKKLLVVFVLAFTSAFSAQAAVDLNTATQAELESISGIGPKKAQAIIDFRKKNGSFKSVDDLDKVPGFGKKTVDEVKKDIVAGSPKAAGQGKVADAKTVKEKTTK
jgi:competence protein ComEA